MARDKTPQEEIETILYHCGVKNSGALAKEINDWHKSKDSDAWSFDLSAAPQKTPEGYALLGFHAHSEAAIIDGVNITLYGAHLDGLAISPDGVYQMTWGGEWDGRDHENTNAGWAPNWWFVDDDGFERPLNPIAWRLVALPNQS